MKRPEVAWLIAHAVPGAGVTVFAWALIAGRYGIAVGVSLRFAWALCRAAAMGGSVVKSARGKETRDR